MSIICETAFVYMIDCTIACCVIQVASKKGKSGKKAKVKKGAVATGKADWKPKGKKAKAEY